MTALTLLLPALAAAILTAATVPSMRRLAVAIGAIDQPGPRKVHEYPIPRLGGLAVLAAVAVTLTTVWLSREGTVFALEGRFLAGIAVGVLPVLIVSIRDDIRPVRAVPKLIAHVVGAGIAVIVFGVSLGASVHLFGIEIPLGWLAAPISIVWIVGLTNAFNIVDGLDGLSAGLALIAALSLAAVCLIESFLGVALIALVLAGALVGFLPYNLHPAKIFLGDSGSAAIGFILACIAIGGAAPRMSAGIAVLVPILVFGLPIAETLISIVRRVLKRLSGNSQGVFEPDREHFHHRLLDLGLGHGRAVLILYFAALLVSACAIGSMFLSSRDAAVLLLTVLAASFIGLSRLRYNEFALMRRGILLKYYDAPVLRMALFAVFFDLAATIFALYAAIAFKYDDWLLTSQRPLAEVLVVLLPPVTVLVFCVFRMYWQSWRFVAVEDLVRSSSAGGTAAALSYLILRATLPDGPGVGFFAIYALLLVGSTNLARASYQLFYNWTRRAAVNSSTGTPVVIYGAESLGTIALRHLLSSQTLGLKPVGFIDDDELKSGKYVNGYPVLGSTDVLADLIQNGKIGAVVVASDPYPRAAQDKIAEICGGFNIPIIPFVVEFRLDAIDLSRARQVRSDVDSAAAPFAQTPPSRPVPQ